MNGDELFDLIGRDCLAEEESLESVASASGKDLELVFLADTCCGDRDIDVVHESDRGTRKDTYRRIGREVRCEVAVEL